MTAIDVSSTHVRSTFPRDGTVHLHDTSVNAWEDTVDEDGMCAALGSVVARMRFRGWRLSIDPECAARWKAIAHLNWSGRKGDLEAYLRVSGRHLQIEFFQNVANVENRNGGRYDFGKYRRMPRTMRLQCAAEMYACIVKLCGLGYELHPHKGFQEPLLLSVMRMAEGRVDEGDALAEFNRHWDSEYDRKRGGHRFERDETGWPSEKELRSWPAVDRDGVPVRNGEMRYTRIAGRLVRGTCRPAVNGQWILVDARGAKLTCIEPRRLFHCDRPDLAPRRLVPRQSERLRKELDKAVAAKNWTRVATLAGVLERLPAATE